MDKKLLDEIDSKKMYKVYDDWPQIAKSCFGQEIKKIKSSEIDHVIFAGMGGSGALGDVFSSILSKTDIHVCVVKGYHLPKTVDSKTLVVIISISGNTDETLSILKSAQKQNCKLICFSSGGLMEEICKKQEVEYRKIEQFHSPRASFTSFLFSILNVLSPILPIKKEDVLQSIEFLGLIQNEISSSNLNKMNPALNLAECIKKIPLIYYPWGLQSAAIRFKNSLQENSKLHVIVEDVVESSHNGIVAWEKKSSVQPIFIRGLEDHIKTKEKFQILSEYFEKKKIQYKEIFSVDGNILSKIICLIYVLDYCSIYKAVLDGIDPSPVESIDFVKKKIRDTDEYI
ncbi:SIS domain-containing protein [Nitrosopumilus adriaticus]|uniref:Glucose-6-phosphate/mannose-6-phosphate isomerase n=1 Tax=Nitrosopumilus adriaticus TaxID=1580092 RepID=A0A0D5C505_9ARCH|nr:SIS domain-containing protein [Nitrosopumilus adriaticus]AJW71786.1 glucose-6-phosphate/mannose-6-phosphate isomerase [Nitrosopumilus adriaticus]